MVDITERMFTRFAIVMPQQSTCQNGFKLATPAQGGNSIRHHVTARKMIPERPKTSEFGSKISNRSRLASGSAYGTGCVNLARGQQPQTTGFHPGPKSRSNLAVREVSIDTWASLGCVLGLDGITILTGLFLPFHKEFFLGELILPALGGVQQPQLLQSSEGGRKTPRVSKYAN